MKKQKLNAKLTLSKSVISNLQSSKVTGGSLACPTGVDDCPFSQGGQGGTGCVTNDCQTAVNCTGSFCLCK